VPSVELLPWTPAQEGLLARAKEQGVVVDFALAGVSPAVSSVEAHREAVFIAVSEFSHRRGCPPPVQLPNGGRLIAVETFYGAGFDHPSGRASLSPPRTPGLWGFAKAFMEPPYPGQLTRGEAERLFVQAIALLLSSPSDATEVWNWPTDWAPYFDAGNDWVGAAAWSVSLPENRVAIVGYSPIE
jgi:hypothetical protein